MWAWLLIFMRTAAEGTLPPNMASLITFAPIAAGLFGCVAGGLLSDRFGRTATTAGLMIVSGLRALIIGAWAMIALRRSPVAVKLAAGRR